MPRFRSIQRAPRWAPVHRAEPTDETLYWGVLSRLFLSALGCSIAADGLFLTFGWESLGWPVGLTSAALLMVCLTSFHKAWLETTLGPEVGRQAWEDGITNLDRPAQQLVPRPLLAVLMVFQSVGSQERPTALCLRDTLVLAWAICSIFLLPFVAHGFTIMGLW